MTLSRLLATLHDDAGDVAVAGLAPARGGAAGLSGRPVPGRGRPAGRRRADRHRPAGRPDLDQAGASPSSASTRRPPRGAPNAIVPVAKAKISRPDRPGRRPEDGVPGAAGPPRAARAVGCPGHADPRARRRAVRDRHDRAGLRRRPGRVRARPGTAPTPVEMGVGGSIPFIATFQELFPGAAILVTGVEDPDSRAHGPNESLHLGEFERVCLAEALLLLNVAETVPRPRGHRLGRVATRRTKVRLASCAGALRMAKVSNMSTRDVLDQLHAAIAALGEEDVRALPEADLTEQIDQLVAILHQLDSHLTKVANAVIARTTFTVSRSSRPDSGPRPGAPVRTWRPIGPWSSTWPSDADARPHRPALDLATRHAPCGARSLRHRMARGPGCRTAGGHDGTGAVRGPCGDLGRGGGHLRPAGQGGAARRRAARSRRRR